MVLSLKRVSDGTEHVRGFRGRCFVGVPSTTELVSHRIKKFDDVFNNDSHFVGWFPCCTNHRGRWIQVTHGQGLGAFTTVGNTVLDSRTWFRSGRVSGQRCGVEEHLVTIVACDESKPTLCVEELDLTGWHVYLCVVIGGGCLRTGLSKLQDTPSLGSRRLSCAWFAHGVDKWESIYHICTVDAMVSFIDVVRGMDHDALARLFHARPDVASPSPGTLTSLAARVTSPGSIRLCLSTLSRPYLDVLEAVAILQSLHVSTDDDTIAHALDSHDVMGPRGPLTLRTLLDTLDALALTYPHNARGERRLAPGVADALGPFPAGFGPAAPDGYSGPTTKNDLISALSPAVQDDALTVITTLTWGPPIARVPRDLMTRTTLTPTHAALRELVACGALLTPEPGTVVLVRDLAFALRDHRTHRGLTPWPAHASSSLTPHPHTPAVTAPHTALTCATHALDTIRHLEHLLTELAHRPAATVRSGALAARELKRLSEALAQPPVTIARLLEVGYAARLLRRDDNEPHDIRPTLAAKSWLGHDTPTRFAELVTWWLASSRTTWTMIDDDGKVTSVVDPTRHDPWVSTTKQHLLTVMDAAGNGATRGLVDACLTWCTPRHTAPSDIITGILDEARFLGVVTDHVLLPGLAEHGPAQALTDALPQPVTQCIIQGDLTVLVPGLPDPSLDDLLTACADIDSRANATTGRFTSESIARAFDRGWSSESLLAQLTQVSVTGIPQPLDYLVRDVARRHGSIRVGGLASYVRLADDALVAAVRASPALRTAGLFELAPRVLGSALPVAHLVGSLRDAGFSVVVEDHAGAIVVADDVPVRGFIPVRAVARRGEAPEGLHGVGSEPVAAVAWAPVTEITDDQVEQHTQLARAVRAAEDASLSHGYGDSPRPEDQEGPGVGSESSSDPVDGNTGGGRSPHAHGRDGTKHLHEGAAVVGDHVLRLRDAIDSGMNVDIDLVDSRGQITTRTVRPLTLDSGRLRVLDPARDVELIIAVHRIVHVQETS